VPLTPEDGLARSVLERYLKVRAGEVVVVETWSHALPWARAFSPEARRLGARPILTVEDEEAFFRSVASSRRVPVPRAVDALAAVGDAYVYLGGPEEFPRLLGLTVSERAHVIDRHGPGWRLRASQQHLRAARLALAGATPTAAARYGVDLAAWRRELLRASLVPPEALRETLTRWLRRGARGRKVRVRHPNGTDLSLTLEPHRWRAEVGEPTRGSTWIDVPTGLLLLPIRPGGAEGVWEANRASFDRFRDPPVIDGARFKFRDGRLRAFEFDRGGEAFAASYAAAGPGRDRPAALTIGLNPEIDRAPERAELGEHSVGLLLGSNLRAGGRRASRLSFLSVVAGADLELDGRAWEPRPSPRSAR
jgi:leucyl aminopeptidase (aminopeptidase T)